MIELVADLRLERRAKGGDYCFHCGVVPRAICEDLIMRCRCGLPWYRREGSRGIFPALAACPTCKAVVFNADSFPYVVCCDAEWRMVLTTNRTYLLVSPDAVHPDAVVTRTS